jgi:DNA repair exonuclease SbcCD ATPase subunit
MEFKSGMDLNNFGKINENDSYMLAESSDDEEEITAWIDAIHAMTTNNYTTYTATELRGDKESHTGVHSWTYPYNKPILTHHNSRSGEPIGRVVDAHFKQKSKISGKPCNRLKVKITDKDAIEKLKDGRYQTVSIGGRAEKAHCSICGQDLLNEGRCEHSPGKEYDGETAHVILGNVTFVEVSFVNVPADSYARIVSMEGDDNYQTNEEFLNESLKKVNLELFSEGDNSSKTSNKIKTSNSKDKNTQGGNRMDEKLENLKERISTKDEKIQVLETKIDNQEYKIKSLEEENEDLSEKVEVKEGKIENMNEEINKLQEQNAELESDRHKRLAEKVVVKKVELGRLKEDLKEDVLDKYVERTTESLEDALSDLEFEEGLLEEEEENFEEGEDVENPGIHNSEESNVETEGKEERKDLEERLKNL